MFAEDANLLSIYFARNLYMIQFYLLNLIFQLNLDKEWKVNDIWGAPNLLNDKWPLISYPLQ